MTETVSEAAGRDDYVMGRTTREYGRLRSQARVLEPATRRVLEQVGIRPGMSCVDVGCGPGEVMRLLGELVGPSGRVTGVDVDGKVGTEALATLRAGGQSHFEFVQGDASIVGELPGHPYDLAYARLVLIHAPDPLALLRTMYGWLRPGGWLVVQDYDLTGTNTEELGEAGQEFERVALRVFEAVGRDVRAGQHLPRYFEDAGLGSPDGTDVAGFLTSVAEAVPMIMGVYRSILPHAIKLGLTSEERSRAVLAELEAAGARNQGWGRWPLLISAWKQKPA